MTRATIHSPRAHAALVGAILAATVSLPAVAQSDAVEEAPPPPVVLEDIPARFSWELALTPSYGMLPQFEDAPPWIGLGFRGAWGRHFDGHRVAAGLHISFEGPITVEWSNVFEPHALWDWVSDKGLWLGASVGPSLMVHATLSGGTGFDTGFSAAPMAAFRIGYSQPFSAIKRRFFVGIEPKVRYVDGDVGVLGAIVIGSGNGY